MENKQFETLINCVDEIAYILAGRVGKFYPEYDQLINVRNKLLKISTELKCEDNKCNANNV